MTDKALMTTALVPVALYLTAMVAIFAMNPSHFPGALMGAGGTVVVMLSVGFTNVLRLRRERVRKG